MNNIKKIFLLFLILIFSFTSVSAKEPELKSPSAILVDAYTGLTLYEKNSNEKMYPASTTKIVTAILAIESGKLEKNETLTASFNAVNSIDYDSSKINLSEGEKMSFENLLYSLIIASANDAANVLAENICKTSDEFVALMNKKVKEIGCTGTHFTNPHGLHDEDHYTTAADLAKITVYAMKLPFFEKAVSLTKYEIPPTNKTDEKRTLTSTNQLLNKNSKYYYQYATGVKTGYTSNAGYCLVSSAKNGAEKYISVVLGAKPDAVETFSFADSKTLLQYGFKNHDGYEVAKQNDIISSIPIKSSFADEALLSAESSVNIILPAGVDIKEVEVREYIKPKVKAPVKTGDLLGRMEWWYDGVKVGECDMVSVSDYSKMPLAFLFKPFYKLFKSTAFYILLALFVVVYFLYLSFKQQKRKRRKRRKTTR